MASSISNRLSREDYKKAKELEELRKTGAAPPELDEDGKMINPHIPQYMAQAPWYLNNNRPGLKHQYIKHFLKDGDFARVGEYHEKTKKKRQASKWQKGSCENCGAATHTVKFCCERPRKKLAKFTHSSIAADEHLQEVPLDYEGKRDRWNGYDPSTYKKVIEHYKRTDKERRKKKAQELDQEFKSGADSRARKKEKAREEAKKKKESKQGDDNEDSDHSDTGTDTDSDTDTDEEEDSDKEDLKDQGKVIQKRDPRTRTTVRNLRIREDTAKYLRNLALNSSHYDPKTRSMRENPHPEKDPEELPYAGDNFIRRGGEVKKVSELQKFVWDATDRGNTDVHVLSNPSQSELLFEQFKKKKEQLKSSKQKNILEKYGGEEHLEAPDRNLLLGVSEAYAEYSQAGEVIRGQEKAIPKTKYIEDHLDNNHTEIWGSFWSTKEQKWGYACCEQLIRNSYCTGVAGKALTAKEE